MICQYCGGVIAHYYGCMSLTVALPANALFTPRVITVTPPRSTK